MEATYDPFAILNLEPGVSLDAARAKYRKLARQHHPDMVGEHERETATKMMAALNEAIAELERDFDGWSARLLPGARPVGPVFENDNRVLSVEPRFVILSEANGFEAFVTVASPSGDGRRIGLRYPEGLIVAERLRMGGRGVANFRVHVEPRVRELDLPERVEVELVAPGYPAAVVTVAVEPFGVRASEGVGATPRRASWWRRLWSVR